MFVKLKKEHNRELFDCGNDEINNYLKQYALQNQEKHYINATYVLLDNNYNIIAYVTLSAVSMKDILNKIRYSCPALLIARVGVDKNHQKNGIGKKLLKFSFEKALLLHENFGCRFIIVKAKDKAFNFYKNKLNFVPINNNDNDDFFNLYLPIKTLLKISK